MLTRQEPKKVNVDLGNGNTVVITVGIAYSGPSVPKPKPGKVISMVAYPCLYAGGPSDEFELSLEVEIDTPK